LKAAEKGFDKMMAAWNTLQTLTPDSSSTCDVHALQQSCYEAMNDDFNTAITIAGLFEAVRIINSVKAGTEKLTAGDIEALKAFCKTFIFDILGLKEEASVGHDEVDSLMKFILQLRADAKAKKDFATSDKIRMS
jgi:cysteinyl-tRNA synthetase